MTETDSEEVDLVRQISHLESPETTTAVAQPLPPIFFFFYISNLNQFQAFRVAYASGAGRGEEVALAPGRYLQPVWTAARHVEVKLGAVSRCTSQ